MKIHERSPSLSLSRARARARALQVVDLILAEIEFTVRILSDRRRANNSSSTENRDFIANSTSAAAG